MYCKHCGKQIEKDSVFCSYCGEKVISLNHDETTKNTELKITNNEITYLRRFIRPMVYTPYGRFEVWQKKEAKTKEQIEALQNEGWKIYDQTDKKYKCIHCEQLFVFSEVTWLQEGWSEKDYKEGHSGAPYHYWCEQCIDIERIEKGTYNH